MSSTFQAAVAFAPNAPLDLQPVTLDPPQTGEVLVALKACAVCHSDLHYISGAWKTPLPAVFGHEAAGEIVELGERTNSTDEELRVGDQVVVSLLRTCGACPACTRSEESLCATQTRLDERSPLRLLEGKHKGTRPFHGLRTAAFAEQVLVARSQVTKISTALDGELACLLGCGVLTGFGAVMNAATPAEGSHLATIGCGGVGLNCIQAARLTKPTTNIAVDTSEVKRKIALELGATHAYAPAPALPAEVRAATRGGADFVFVAVGNTHAMSLGFDMLRPGGCMVVVGMTQEGETFSIDASMLATEGKTVRGSKMGDASLQRDVAILLDLHARGLWNLERLAGERFPFQNINKALDVSRSEGTLRSIVLF